MYGETGGAILVLQTRFKVRKQFISRAGYEPSILTVHILPHALDRDL